MTFCERVMTHRLNQVNLNIMVAGRGIGLNRSRYSNWTLKEIWTSMLEQFFYARFLHFVLFIRDMS